ncbi:hypothetical protein GGQ80_000870 [Sphingomonas jinjuensis]|uniref:Uncharacterized protein n=1 Tax=Sphingomonas jinjuensis TaxID=535907 RepID=A0A840F8P5_9SPHN|nr:hypothetical protein [Sphingomonas jinjuensis]MBB4152982.1 hypothetical protein [Sphingomonas jinjuensis]
MPADERGYAERRATIITVAQPSIGVTTHVGRVAVISNAYYVATAEAASRSAELKIREQIRAESSVAPLRDALADFDVRSLALAATQRALVKLPWLKAEDPSLADGPPGVTAMLAMSVDKPRLVQIDYRYALSPDFAQIRVLAQISLRRRAQKPGANPDTSFRQVAVCVAPLRRPDYEHFKNVRIWSADRAKLARHALTDCFGRMANLIPYALNLTDQGLASLNAKTHLRAYGAGLYAPVIERDDADRQQLMLWSDGPVDIRPVP